MPGVRDERSPSTTAVATLLAFICGCGGPVGGAKVDDPWGEPAQVPMLAAFQGDWEYDFERTADIRRTRGAAQEEIERERTFRESNPVLADLGAKVSISGHVVTGDPFEFSEYRLFGLHEHGDTVCGKAWHHEDANDPGDMSKCFVKLRRVGKELYFDLWMPEGQTDLDDPDLAGGPGIVSGSAADCEAPPASGASGGWSTRVFVRAGS